MKLYFTRYVSFWVLCVVAVCSLFLMYSGLSQQRNLKIVFLDVGQGDATFIITPNGRQILIDAGKYPDISASLATYMPTGDRSIDMVIATHPDIDHIAGFNTLLDEYQLGQFMHSGLLAGAPVYRQIANKVRNKKIPSQAVFAGQNIQIDTDVVLRVLSPYQNQKIDNPNDHSVVLQLLYKDRSIILTGDASRLIEQNILSMYGSLLSSDILKIGHHGSKTSTDDSFVKQIGPKYGVISAACNNSFGHPHASVLRVLDEHDVIELNTCEKGDIVFEFLDGKWMLQE